MEGGGGAMGGADGLVLIMGVQRSHFLGLKFLPRCPPLCAMAWAPSAEWIFKHPQHTLKVCEFRGKCFFGLEVLFCSIGLPAGVG